MTEIEETQFRSYIVRTYFQAIGASETQAVIFSSPSNTGFCAGLLERNGCRYEMLTEDSFLIHPKSLVMYL
jgi:hypothetical protein